MERAKKRVQLGREGSGAVTVTSKTQGSPSKALLEAAFSHPGHGLLPYQDALSIHLYALASSIQHDANRTWKLLHLWREVQQETEALCNLMPVKEEHKLGQREPRTCPGPMPMPTLNVRKRVHSEQ